MDYAELLSREQFISNDPSMTYPVSGLYSLFLLHHSLIDKYLSLYRIYSGGNEEITKMTIDSTDLPEKNSWLTFVNEYQKNELIHFPEKYPGSPLNSNYSVKGSKDDYLFVIKDTLLIEGSELIPGYDSKSFKELFPGRVYQGEKYAIIASNDEVSVYNLYTNNLAAKYVRSFSLKQTTVPQNDGFYSFFVNKKVFDEELTVVE